MIKAKPQLGLTILNSDLVFQCKQMYYLENNLFVLTKTNEILCFTKEEDKTTNLCSFEKKFLILNNIQERENILNIFSLKSNDKILGSGKKILVAISENLVIYYYSFTDGLCLNKLNLSIYKTGEIKKICALKERFLLFFLSQKLLIFDTFTNEIFKDELMQVMKKDENEESQFFEDIINNNNTNNYNNNTNSYNYAYNHGVKKEEPKKENKYENFLINAIYQIKENKFFIKTTKNETYFLILEGFNKFGDNEIKYEETKIKIFKQNFELNNFFNEDNFICLFSDDEFLFYTKGTDLKVCFLDSVDELTEISSYQTHAKYPIIYIGTINLFEDKKGSKNNEHLIVIFKDLTVKFFEYNKKVRELIPKENFMLMVEDEFLEMKYITTDNLIIGYTESEILIFDLKRNAIRNEKYIDRSVNLRNIFERSNKKLFFTNYFMMNFNEYLRDSLYVLNGRKKILEIKDINNDKINNNNSINNNPSINNKNVTRKSSCINKNVDIKILNKPFKITCSLIYAFSENSSLYYLIGTDSGKVAIFDIFFSQDYKISPVILIDQHKSPIETFNIYQNRILIISSKDGLISFTEFTKDKLASSLKAIKIDDNFMDLHFKEFLEAEYGSIKKGLDEYNKIYNTVYIEKLSKNKVISNFKEYKNGEQKNKPGSFFPINFMPKLYLKSYDSLKKISPIIQLDSLYMLNDKIKQKCDEMLGFITKSNEVIIVRMDLLKEMYRFNQANSRLNIEGIYHVPAQKSLIFYLSNNTVKISSYSTCTCDRHISDINKIYDLLRVEDNLNNVFRKDLKLDDFVRNNNNEILYFDEAKYKESKDKKDFISNINKNNNYNSNNSDDLDKKNKINSLIIKKLLEKEKQKNIFISKLYQISFNKTQSLRSSLSKFEAAYMKKFGDLIIDKIISILNDNISEELKKIKILNLVNNPALFMKITTINKYERSEQGVCSTYLRFGDQYNQILTFDFEDFFSFIENKIKKSNDYSKKRENYFNILSLFHIWNFSLDLDYELFEYFKLSQPIFDFHPILIGRNSVYSILLTDEVLVDENNLHSNKFSNHLKYYLQNFIVDKKSTKNLQKTLFTNRSLLLETQMGFLVNMKSYRISSNVSHMIHLGLFGALVALLGYKENEALANFIHKEKKVIKILTQKKEIKFSSFRMLRNFLFEGNEDIMIANKSFLLLDYIQLQYNMNKNENNVIIANEKFQNLLRNMMDYLRQVYKYIFNLNDESKEIYEDFSSLKKESNLDYGYKSEFLSEYELALINFLLLYHSSIKLINPNSHDLLSEPSLIQLTHLLVLFVFKMINNKILDISFSKIVFDLFDKISDILNIVYIKNPNNYALFLIQYYCGLNLEIDLNSVFKKYNIGLNLHIIKSEESHNFMKIILAKHIKSFAKTKINSILKIIVDEFKRPRLKEENINYYSFLIEILFLIFKDKSTKLVQYLPTVINQIMNLMNPINKDIKNVCLENSKKILTKLISHYPMIAFHLSTQKLAVGSIDGKITIFDMTTGSIWKNLIAHNNVEIDALIFESSGNSIISYCSKESIIKAFKISLANFFGNFFSMKEYKSKKLDKIKENISSEQKLEIVRFVNGSKNGQVLLTRENGKCVEFNC